MTGLSAVSAAARAPSRREARPPNARPPLPPLSPTLHLARSSFVAILVISVSLLFELVVVSRITERSAQARAFTLLRSELAQGTAPLGPTDTVGRELRPGTPVAYLEIPEIALKEVVIEGTTAGDLFVGPGHRRDTPLPGQVGVSVLLGRRAGFGGPFARISHLRAGAAIRVTTGQGRFQYRVLDVRVEGDRLPPAPAAGRGRLVLATASGSSFVPTGVVQVDADLAEPALPGPARLLSSTTLPATERAMAADPRTLWALALWLQCTIAAVVAATWAWHRWGRAQAWVVFLPVLLLVGQFTSEQAARLLPNLL